MAKGDPITSPWIYEAKDYADNALRITVVFNNVNRKIQTCEVFRDANCVYKNVILGVGTDGSPDSSTFKIPVPVGTTPVPITLFTGKGFNTIEEVLGVAQVTASP